MPLFFSSHEPIDEQHGRNPRHWDERLLPFPPWRLEIDWLAYQRNGVPPTHGAAFRHGDRDIIVCYPLPFNFFISWWRDFVWNLRFPPWRFAAYKRELIAKRGWLQGYEVGLDVGRLRRPGCDFDHEPPPKRILS